MSIAFATTQMYEKFCTKRSCEPSFFCKSIDFSLFLYLLSYSIAQNKKSSSHLQNFIHSENVKVTLPFPSEVPH